MSRMEEYQAAKRILKKEKKKFKKISAEYMQNIPPFLSESYLKMEVKMAKQSAAVIRAEQLVETTNPY